MERSEFKQKLSENLDALNAAEKDEILSFFDECLDEALESGESEEEAFVRLGDPAAVAEKLLAEHEGSAVARASAVDGENVFDANEVKGIRVNAKDAGIRLRAGVKAGEETLVRVSYKAHKDEVFSVAIEDGVLVVKEYWPKTWMGLLWGITRLVEDGRHRVIEMEVPRHFAGFVELEASNHALSAERLTLGSLSARTSNAKAEAIDITSAGDLILHSSNAMVKLHNSSAEGNVHVETQNGKVEAKNVSGRGDMTLRSANGRVCVEDCQARTVKTRTSNGKIQLVRTMAEDDLTAKTGNGAVEVEVVGAGRLIKLSSSNGSIKGILKGSASQYTVSSHSSNAKVSPPSGGNGPIKLDISTSNADIDIDFEKPYKVVFGDA